MNHQSKISLVKLQGLAVRVSDVRGFEVTKNQRHVVLQNGMKLAVTQSESETVKKALAGGSHVG